MSQVETGDSLLSRGLLQETQSLPPEIEEGNVEYKLKLTNISDDRMQQLITQMKWRLAEGNGECFYELGVSDRGVLIGMTEDELKTSIENIKGMAAALGAEVMTVRESWIGGDARKQCRQSRIQKEIRKIQNKQPQTPSPAPTESELLSEDPDIMELFADELAHEQQQGARFKVAEVLIRKTGKDQPLIELRIAFLGLTDAGKSTLLGFLAHGELDNGRGKARLNLLRHRHELETGRSSSLSHSIIGFTASGELLHNGATSRVLDMSDARNAKAATSGVRMNHVIEAQIVDSASKLLMLIDTCGHEKYMKTTLSSLTGYDPDYACLVVDGTSGQVDALTRELCGYAMVLSVPVFIVITKIDMANSEHAASRLQSTVKSLIEFLMLPGSSRVPVVVQSTDELVLSAQNFVSQRVTPIFFLSCLTGENTELLIRFLNLLPPRDTYKKKSPSIDETETTEFSIEEIFSVSGVGSVVGGRLLQGTLMKHPTGWFSMDFSEEEECKQSGLWIGPMDHLMGEFSPVTLNSVHRQRRPVRMLRQGQTGTLALSDFNRDHLRKGMVIVGGIKPQSSWEFEALMWVLYAPPNCELCLLSSDTKQFVATDFSTRKRKISENMRSSAPPDTKKRSNLTRLGFVHVGNVRQTAFIVGVQIEESSNFKSLSVPSASKAHSPPSPRNDIHIETGMRIRVRFRFTRAAEFIKSGMRLFYREDTDLPAKRHPRRSVSEATKDASHSKKTREHGLKLVGEVFQK